MSELYQLRIGSTLTTGWGYIFCEQTYFCTFEKIKDRLRSGIYKELLKRSVFHANLRSKCVKNVNLFGTLNVDPMKIYMNMKKKGFVEFYLHSVLFFLLKERNQMQCINKQERVQSNSNSMFSGRKRAQHFLTRNYAVVW